MPISRLDIDDDECDERMSEGFSYQRRDDADPRRDVGPYGAHEDLYSSNESTTRHRTNASSQPLDHAPFGVDRVPGMEPLNHPGALRRESFIADFAASDGPPQIVILVMLLALGFGSTIGVVPAVMSDRYARINHGYNDLDKSCSDYTSIADKPQACLDGSADAQTGVATEQLIANVFTFFTSSLVGSLSDEHGRKGILVAGLLLSCLSPLSLVLLQLSPTMSPNWYYAAGGITGLINWTTVALSSLGDVMPPKWRAPSFGLLLAGFSLGFALAPQLALLLGHFGVSVFALITVLLSLLVTIVSFPETLKPEQAAEARNVRRSMVAGMTRSERIIWNVKRPIWELSILNRNRLFRLLSLLAFFSGMVTSGDRTLIIYYIEERLGFNDQDIATMFLIMGVLGIFIQGVMLKILNDAVGERWLVTLCFVLSAIHNILYGIAKDKATIYVAVAVSSFGAMAFPTISAIKSNNVSSSEQGRIQGALYSLSALASASGPMVLRWVYQYTRDGAFAGPGSMFLVAAMLDAVAVLCAYALPPEANSSGDKDHSHGFVPPSDVEDDEEDRTVMIGESNSFLDQSVGTAPNEPESPLL